MTKKLSTTKKLLVFIIGGLFFGFINSAQAALVVDNTVNSTDSAPELFGFQVPATGQCEMVAQSFQTSSTIQVDTIRLRHSKEQSPTDNIIVSVQADNAGKPSGTMLTSSTWNGTNLPGSNGIVTHDYTVSSTLSGLTTYWIVTQRSGAYDGTNYYRDYDVTTDYPYGSAKCQNSNNWATATNHNDLYFQVYGTVIIPPAPPVAALDTDVSQWFTDYGVTFEVVMASFLLLAFSIGGFELFKGLKEAKTHFKI